MTGSTNQFIHFEPTNTLSKIQPKNYNNSPPISKSWIRACKNSRIRDAKRHKKTRFRDSFKTPPRFRDWNKNFWDPEFSGYRSPPLSFTHRSFVRSFNRKIQSCQFCPRLRTWHGRVMAIIWPNFLLSKQICSRPDLYAKFTHVFPQAAHTWNTIWRDIMLLSIALQF